VVDELAAAQAAAGGNLEAVLTVDARTAAFNDGVGGGGAGGGGAGGENGENGGGGRDGGGRNCGAPPPSSPATATTRWLRPVPRLLVGKTVRRLKVAKPPKAAADEEKDDEGEQREQGEHGKEEDEEDGGEPPRPVLTFATTLEVATRPTVGAPGGLAPRARVTSVLL
jgi:hypothetical protein